MAQVIKYQQGGSTPTQKYGTFTIDGNQYQVDDDFLNQMSSYGKTLDQDTAYQFSKITDALRSGANLSYDSSADRLEGVQFDVTNNQAERLGKRRSRLGRSFGNLWRGKENTARNAVHALKDFQYKKPVEALDPINIRDWSSDITMEYKRNKDTGDFELVNGNRVYINGANNLKATRRLRSLKDIAGYGDNDQFKGYNDLDKQAYIDFYNKYGEQGIEDIISRLEQGNWTDEDAMALDDIGIFLGGSKPVQAQKEVDPAQEELKKTKENWSKAGWDYDKYHNLFNVDSNGNVTINNPELLSYIGTGDAWLNNEFKRKYGSYADYIPDDSGLFVINGKVYRGDDQDSLSKIQKYLDFVADNKRTAGNSSIIKQYWDENRSRSPWFSTSVDSEGNPMWSPYFQPNRYAADLTGNYVRQAGDPLVYDYFPNYNPEDSSQFDPYGHPLRTLAERVYIDPLTKQRINYNNTLQEQLDPNIVNSYYENNPTTAFNSYYTIGNTGGYKEVASTGDASNPQTRATLYYNPQTQLYYFHDENPGNDNYTLNSRLPGSEDSMRNYYWNIDSRLGQYIEQHPEILRDPEVKGYISDIIRNPYIATISTRHAKFNPIIGQKYPDLYQLFQDLIKTQTLGKYQQQYSGTGGNSALRSITTPEGLEQLGLAYRVPSNKNGGVIKYQIGGVAANRVNSAKASKQAIQQSDKKLRAAGEEKTIGDGTQLTAADKAEIAALVADAASLGATFVPGFGNVAGAGVGAVGSLTGFGADIARDGLDWGDVSNLALNLGLDAATLLPGIGSGAKAAKIAKALKKSKAIANAVKWATRGVSFGSAASGLATAWENIQDGKWTIKDVRTVLNGVRGFANLKRNTGSAKLKGGNSDMVTLKPTNNKNLPTIKLGRSEIESVNSLPKNQKTEKLEEIIIGKLGKAKTDNITDLLSEYGIKRSSNVNFNWKKPWKSSMSKGLNTGQFKYDELPSTYRNPDDMGWWNWNKTAATRDAKTNRSNPYFKNYADKQTSQVQRFFGGPEMFTSVTALKRRPITMPIYSNLAPNLGIFSNQPQHLWYYKPENNPVFYKKGGKIIKAQPGTKYPTFSTPIDQNWTSVADYMLDKNHNPINVQVDPVAVVGTPIKRASTSLNKAVQSPQNTVVRNQYNSILNDAKMAQINNNLGFKGRLDSKEELLNDSTSRTLSNLNRSSYNTDNSDYTAFGHGKGKGFNINPDMVMGIGDFITSTIGINRTTQKMKDAIRKGMIGSQQQMPTEFYSRFSDNGLHKMYNDRIKSMRQYKTSTSDPNKVLAERLMRDMNVDQLEGERDAKFSQMIDQYNDKLLAQKQQYANIRTQITNENRNRWAQGLAQLDMADANKITQQTQNVKNLIYQLRGDYAKDLNEKQALQAQLAQQKAAGDFSNWFTNFRNSKINEFYNWQQNEGKNPEYSGWKIDDYLNYKYSGDIATNISKYGIEALVNPYQQSQRRFWLGGNKLDTKPYLINYTNPEQIPIQRFIPYSYKSGGRYLRKTDEQQYLDQQKAINKAVGELNNNIIKLFLKMMS